MLPRLCQKSVERLNSAGEQNLLLPPSSSLEEELRTATILCFCDPCQTVKESKSRCFNVLLHERISFSLALPMPTS